MTAIADLTPLYGPDELAALRRLDADELARCAADRARPWWQRRACVQALAGRLPQPWTAELIARVQDPDETSEVRIALLDLLGDRAELLPWLRHEDRAGEGAYGMREAFLKARGVLGDLDALPGLAAVAAGPWPHRRETGEAGLDALVARYGPAAVLAELGEGPGSRFEDRLARVRLRHAAGQDVTDALADPDHAVAHRAAELADDPAALRGLLAGQPTVDTALWALWALHRLTGDTAETRAGYRRLGSPRVEVPGLPEDVRRAVLHEYAGTCERDTDPRWRVEALCTEPPAPVDVDGQLRRAVEVLTAEGAEPKEPVSAGEDNQQGDGCYHVIYHHEDVSLFVSTLGPFVHGDEGEEILRGPLERAGLRWIDDAVTETVVAGLCVYYFGERVPLKVDTLLFYWQD
ncbi:hypothetical protein VM98_31730 [Streptomyces rubellomurinus subsp. indigoferus]|nr:hypothetical protein VM98_31730 [Streptomyces rubellomurinus subsp. indigoferus]